MPSHHTPGPDGSPALTGWPVRSRDTTGTGDPDRTRPGDPDRAVRAQPVRQLQQHLSHAFTRHRNLPRRRDRHRRDRSLRRPCTHQATWQHDRQDHRQRAAPPPTQLAHPAQLPCACGQRHEPESSLPLRRGQSSSRRVAASHAGTPQPWMYRPATRPSRQLPAIPAARTGGPSVAVPPRPGAARLPWPSSPKALVLALRRIVCSPGKQTLGGGRPWVRPGRSQRAGMPGQGRLGMGDQRCPYRRVDDTADDQVTRALQGQHGAVGLGPEGTVTGEVERRLQRGDSGPLGAHL